MDRAGKQDCYDGAKAEIAAAFEKTSNLTARTATVAAVLHRKLGHFFWTGFYLLVDGELTVGPYQGSPACIVLPAHRGVCWAGLDRGRTVVVPNVHEFPDHIACDGLANSEIVVPLRKPDGTLVGVLDVDSSDFEAFDEIDVANLEDVLRMLYF